MDWSDAYAVSAHIPGADAIFARWAKAVETFRADANADWAIPYGDHPLEKLDLIHPEGTPEGLAVFVHGGYWMETDRDLWTWAARGAVAAGWAVAIPGYVKAPEVRLSDIPPAIARAIDTAASRIPGPIRLAGHSAGGHIVTRILCGTPHPRIDHVLSISGLHDLRPLMWTGMNATLKITEAEAQSESPALLRPAMIPTIAWVGGDERPVFIDQSRALAAMWTGLGVPMRLEIDEPHNHFTILDALTDARSPLTQAFIGATP